MGLMDVPKISDYWKTSWESHIPFFSKVMPRNRFQNILSFLHVSRTPPGAVSKKIDKIKMFTDRLFPKFSALYNPNEDISIDETMIGYRGRFGAIQYMPQKPTKWGIKVYSIADSANCYMLGCIVYTGSETYSSGSPYANLPKTTQVVMNLVEPYLDKGYHLYTDRFYSSVPLATQLATRSTQFTGTVNNRRAHLPQHVRETGRSKISIRPNGCKAFRHDRMFVAVWRPEKKKKNIYMSTGHTAEYVTVVRRGRRTKSKPSVIHQYNQWMNGVDMSDQLSVYYSFNRKSIKWWKKVFFWSMEIAVVNSYIIYEQSSPHTAQLDYRRQIINSLIAEFFQSQPATPLNTSRRLFPSPLPERLDQRKHFLGKRKEQRECRVCSDRRQRKGSQYFSKTCPSQPTLCPVPCFEKYHTQPNL